MTRRRVRPSKMTLRNADVRRVLEDRYKGAFPDDDAGRDDIFLALQARAPLGEGEIDLRKYITRVAPWMTVGDSSRLLDRVFEKPLKFKADTLGRHLGLTDAKRTELKAFTIGAIDVP